MTSLDAESPIRLFVALRLPGQFVSSAARTKAVIGNPPGFKSLSLS
jgi:hypothetical protein